jgi:hypothetical protein
MLQGGRKQRKKRQEVENKAHTVLTLGLDQITKGCLTQGVFILDRVKSSSFDCPEKIPVDSNVSCSMSFNSGSSSPEDAEFCPTLRLVYFYCLSLSLHLCTIQIL